MAIQTKEGLGAVHNAKEAQVCLTFRDGKSIMVRGRSTVANISQFDLPQPLPSGLTFKRYGK